MHVGEEREGAGFNYLETAWVGEVTEISEFAGQDGFVQLLFSCHL